MSNENYYKALKKVLNNHSLMIKQEFHLSDPNEIFNNGVTPGIISKHIVDSYLERVAKALSLMRGWRSNDSIDIIEIQNKITQGQPLDKKTKTFLSNKIKLFITKTLIKSIKKEVVNKDNARITCFLFGINRNDLNSAYQLANTNALIEDADICFYTLPQLIEKGISVEEVMKDCYRLVDLYFPDEDSETNRLPKFKRWCEVFYENTYNYKAATIKLNSEIVIIGYIDCYLVTESFFNEWKLGINDISDLVIKYPIGPKYISKSEPSYILVETMIIDQKNYKLQLSSVTKLVQVFKKYLQEVASSFNSQGYNLKNFLAHGYTKAGMGHLYGMGYSKIGLHSNIVDDSGEPTELFKKKIEFQK